MGNKHKKKYKEFKKVWFIFITMSFQWSFRSYSQQISKQKCHKLEMSLMREWAKSLFEWPIYNDG